MLPVLMLGDYFALAAHWRRWETRLLRLLIPGALLGVTVGTFVLTNISPQALRRSLGVLALLFILYKLLEKRFPIPAAASGKVWLGFSVGTLAGFTSTLAHAAGPWVSMYLILQRLQPRTFVSTSVLYFTLLNLIKTPYYWAAGMFDWETQLKLAWVLPAVPLGVWLGRRLAQQVSKTSFDRIILGLLAVTAIILLQ
jgi:hypothetical protein